MNRSRLFRYSSEHIIQAKATDKSVHLMFESFYLASVCFVCIYQRDLGLRELKSVIYIACPFCVVISVFQVFGFVYNFTKCCAQLICKINKIEEEKKEFNYATNIYLYHWGPV